MAQIDYQDAYDYGVYILQQYAHDAGVEPQTVVTNYIAKYSAAEVASVGALAQGVNIGVINSKFSNLQVSNPESPDRASINQALLDAGGTGASIIQDVVGGVEDTASQVAAVSLTTLKYVAIAAAVLGILYVAIEYKALKSVAKL